MRKLLPSLLTAGLTLAVTAAAPDALATPEDCEEPLLTGAPDLSAPDDDAWQDDASPIVDLTRTSFARGGALDISSWPTATSLEVAADIDEEAIHTDAAGAAYATVMFDDVRVRVVNATSPSTISEPADLVLDVGTRSLLGLTLIATYTPFSGTNLLSVSAAPDSAGGGTGIPLGPSVISAPGGCLMDAWSTLVTRIPDGMPPVKIPKMTGACTEAQCVAVKRSWIRGHIALFWAHLAMEGLAGADAGQREYAWGRPGRDANGQLTDPHTAPKYWFGEYSGDRFWDIREVVNDLWNVFRNARTGGFDLRQHCPPASDVGNLCFTAEPSAHHALIWRIEYCDEFFNRDVFDQTRLSLHEATHWLWTGGAPVKDWHLHSHGASCLGSPVGERIYGEEVHELATYENASHSSCGHRDIAVHTVDAYARMINWIGSSMIDGTMVSWPAWGDPTPEPPNCDPLDRGTEGCECAAVEQFGDYSSPDGDYSIDQVCYDNDGEMSCATVTFNASDTVGICTRCGADERAAGCTCMHQDDCAQGLFCYGTDTANGGSLGHCYDDHPPSWVCLADCQELFNDPQAYCYHDRLGGARCLDSLCGEPDEEKCIQNGMVCRYGECVVECTNKADCDAQHFPESFVCIGNVCQRPD